MSRTAAEWSIELAARRRRLAEARLLRAAAWWIELLEQLERTAVAGLRAARRREIADQHTFRQVARG